MLIEGSQCVCLPKKVFRACASNLKCIVRPFFTEAVNCLSKAIDIYTDMGRFTIAAKHHQTIAEMYESDIADLERAMQHYEKSADYFRVGVP